MADRQHLLGLSNRQLLDLLCTGHPIDPSALDDTEYRGISLGLPRFIEKLTWKTFQKTFHRDPATGALRGWNVRLEQRGLDAESVPQKLKSGAPKTFGHYQVVPLEGRRLPRPARAGLLIDYGVGGNAALDVMRFIRDPLVAVNTGSVELLLGGSFLELGPLLAYTPAFFLLERERKLTHVAQPARTPASMLRPR
jgi:hypothetical protein